MNEKYRYRAFVRGCQWIPKWQQFISPISGYHLFDRVYFGPIEIRRFPK